MSQEKELPDHLEDESQKKKPHLRFNSNAHANAARATRSPGDSTDFISPSQLNDMIEGSERLTFEADKKLLDRLNNDGSIKASKPKSK